MFREYQLKDWKNGDLSYKGTLLQNDLFSLKKKQRRHILRQGAIVLQILQRENRRELSKLTDIVAYEENGS